jgi:hypothetical protein
MDTNADTLDEHYPDTVGTPVWGTLEPGAEAGAMFSMPADAVAQIDAPTARGSGAWAWLEWLEPLGTLLEGFGALLELLAPLGK